MNSVEVFFLALGLSLLITGLLVVIIYGLKRLLKLLLKLNK